MPITAYDEGLGAQSSSAKSVMMRAHSLAPLHLSHPDKMEWMADYFLRNYRGDTGAVAIPVQVEYMRDAGTAVLTVPGGEHLPLGPALLIPNQEESDHAN